MKAAVNNGKIVKSELYLNHQSLGKHKADNLDGSSNISTETPSSKLSKLAFKRDAKPSIISLSSEAHQTVNSQGKTKKENGIQAKSNRGQNLSLITLASKHSHFINKSSKIDEEVEIKYKPKLLNTSSLNKDCVSIGVENGDSCKLDMDEDSCKLDMDDVLKSSFQLREKLTKKNDTSEIQNAGMRLCDVTEWSISSNDSFSHLLNPNPTISNDSILHKTQNSDITLNKIVEPIINCRRGNSDISWENPVIGISNKSGIPSLVSKDKKLRKCDKVYSSCSFNKDMLKTVQVIGPVDNKYIACLLHLNELEEMLVVVDQHAAHERIRLEKLLNQVGYYTGDNKKIIGKSTQLSPPAIIKIYEDELNMMLHYKKEFKDVGLNFSFVRSTKSPFHRVFIASVPAIFVNGYELQLEANGSVVNTDFLKEFIREQMEYMRSTGCPSSTSSRTIFKALASYACHGAIRFGDKISHSTCKWIMTELSKCDLPFQCAHGRPTIIPIFKLNFLDDVLKKSLPKPNLKKLKNMKIE